MSDTQQAAPKANIVDELTEQARKAADRFAQIEHESEHWKRLCEEQNTTITVLRSEVANLRGDMKALKVETANQVRDVNERKHQFERYAIELTAQIATLEEVLGGMFQTFRMSFDKAIKMSKTAAFNKPILSPSEVDSKHDDGLRQIAENAERLAARGVTQDHIPAQVQDDSGAHIPQFLTPKPATIEDDIAAVTRAENEARRTTRTLKTPGEKW